MGRLDRLILALCALFLVLLSGVTAAVALGWGRPLEVIEFMLADGQRRIILAAGAVGLGILAGRYLYIALGRPAPRRALVHSSETGDVTVSLSAIRNLVGRVGRTVAGVRDIDTAVTVDGDRLSLSTTIRVSPDVNIPDTAQKLQRQIERFVADVVGVEVSDVKVLVRDIGDRRRSRRQT